MSKPLRKMSRLEHWLRVLVYFVGLVPIFAWYELASQIRAVAWSKVRPAGRIARFNSIQRAWGCTCFRWTCFVLRTRLDVVGEIPDGRFVIVSNHQSTADIPILFWVFNTKNCKFVAKLALGQWIPLISVSLAKGGGGLIRRDGSRDDLKTLKRLGRDLEEWDACAMLFAEGTRSRTGELLPYHSAATRIVARESGLPLLPVAIDGTFVATDLPGFARDMPGSYGRVTVGAPIPPEEWEGRLDEVVQEIREWTEEVIEKGRAEGALPRPAGCSARAELPSTETDPD